MTPLIRPAGLPFSDVVMFKKFTPPKANLREKVVAYMNPANPTDIKFSRVIATEGQWI